MEAKYKLSKPDKDCSTRFLERDGSTLSCPFHICYDEKNKPSNTVCGDWCPLMDIIQVGEGEKVQLHCGSGNAEYEIAK